MRSASRRKIRDISGPLGPRVFRLGPVDVKPGSGRVTGPGGDRKLDPKVMDVLVRLAAAGEDVVSRETLMDDVWKDTVVTDFALSRCIYQLRKNLGEVAQTDDSPIETLPKLGYRLTWPVEETGLDLPAEKNRFWPLLTIMFVAVLVVAGIATWGVRERSPVSTSRPAIAVMPFTDLSPDEELGYFGDGVASSLLTELGHISEVDVIARTSSFHFKNRQAGIGEIAEAMDIDYLVEGSVNGEGETVQVTATLVDVNGGRQVWSETFEGVTGQSFTAQQDIAVEIAGYLEVSLGDQRKHGGTTSFEAFRAYLRAIESRDPDVAEVFFDEALAHDPDFARAIAAKVNLTYIRMWQGVGSEEQTWSEMRPLLERALVIADELPLAHALIGGFQIQLGNYPAAEIALQRALEINPSYSYALVHLSRLMARTGRLQEAISLAERNAQLDPLNSFRHLQLANRRWSAGDIDGGKASFERALEINPLNYTAWRDYSHRLADLEGVIAGFRLVARLQENPEFRSRFTGDVPEISPSGVQLFALWFGFIGDFERERQMLQLQSDMADNARLHRELAWALIGEGDLEAARREAWIGLNGMPREEIVNFQVAYLALQTSEGFEEVISHFRKNWPGLFEAPIEISAIPRQVVIGTALIRRVQGDETQARQLLELLLAEGEDPLSTRAMALAHLGDVTNALIELEGHVKNGGYFSYLPGDPFWAPLAGERRFLEIVEAESEKDARIRAEVNAMLARGELILPGHIDS